MAWYYYLNGGNQGPVDVSELQRLHERNVISSETPVWAEGMADWATYGTSTAASPATATLTPLARTDLGAIQTCAECGKPFPESEMLKYENSWVCAECKPVFFQRLKEGAVRFGTLIYASVGARFLAIMIDAFAMVAGMFLLLVPFLMVASIRQHGNPNDVPGWVMAIIVIDLIVVYTFPITYDIFLTGKYGATFGKMALKIRIVKPDGSHISYGRATGRHFAKVLSALILYIGFLMPFWDEEKRALHDHICGTRVVVTKAT